MAKVKNSPSPQQPVSVEPPTDELKGLFEAYGIPLETSYAALIDVADCGRRATGQSPDFPAALDSGLALDANRQLRITPDMAKGVVVGTSGVRAIPGTAVTVGDTGIGIIANGDRGIAISNNGIRVIANENKGITIDSAGLKIKEGFRAIPVGAIMMWPSSLPTSPEGWFPCEGGEFDTTKYPQLASVLNSNTLPDFRGRYPCGADATNSVMTYLSGRTGMPDGFSLSVADDPGHEHTYKPTTDKNTYDFLQHTAYADIHDTTSNTTAVSDHTHTIKLSFSTKSDKSRPESIGSRFLIAHDYVLLNN